MLFRATYLMFLLVMCTMAEYIYDFWKAMDPGYNTSFLVPMEDLETESSLLQCSALALDNGLDAFGFEDNTSTCSLLDVDFYAAHHWRPEPEIRIFLRDVGVIHDDYVDGCGFHMPIVETLLTWNEAETECWNHQANLLEVDSGIHECVIMQLQYLRKPSSNSYWVDGRYQMGMWEWSVSGWGVEDILWLPGEPDNHPSKKCVLLEAGGSYGLRSAGCSERHYALCEYWPPA